jgi:hypothetical protein
MVGLKYFSSTYPGGVILSDHPEPQIPFDITQGGLFGSALSLCSG